MAIPSAGCEFVFDRQFRPVANEFRGHAGPKLTDQEANVKRLVTKKRWVVEATNAALREQRILNSRITDVHFFDPVGDMLPEYPHIPKFEVLFANCASNIVKNRKGFEEQWALPSLMDWQTMGVNFYERLFMKNPFCHFREIQFDVNFSFPRGWHRGNSWEKVPFDSMELEFPLVNQADLTMVSHGPYQIKCVDKYITDMMNREVFNMFEGYNRDDIDFTWEDWDLLCSRLPENDVYYYDQINRPENWDDDDYGPWFRRRIVHLKIPSLHSAVKMHNVVIAYVPTSWEDELLGPNFVNRFGFIQPGLRNILDYACVGKDCPVGYRTAGCCGHVMACIVYLSIYSRNNAAFKTTYRPWHFVDPKKHPRALNAALHNS